MKGNTTLRSRLFLAVCAVLMTGAIILSGCPTEPESKIPATAKRLISGTIGGGASQSQNIRSLSRSSRSVFRDEVPGVPEVPEAVDTEPFFLDTDPGTAAPAGLTALKGKVQAQSEDGEDIVIILEGFLDNASGHFVAAGVDSQDFGVGIQIEGVFKNGTVEDVKITIKIKDMVEESENFEEWEETEVDYDSVDSDFTAEETADQEEGLPAAWTGKYVSVSDADYWETIIDLYLEHQGISTESTKGADGTTTVGKALGGIFAEEGNVFVLVAPMAWSHVVDFAAMDTALSAKLIEEGFSNPANIMDKLHDAMAVYEKIFYCSFLEIAQGDATKDEKVVNPNDTNGPLIDGKEDPNSYYALAMNILPDLTTGEEQNRLFTRYRIQIYHDDLSVPGMTNNRDQLQLFPAYDLTHTWPAVEGNQQGEVQHYICDTAAEARDGKEFLGSNASPWTFGRE